RPTRLDPDPGLPRPPRPAGNPNAYACAYSPSPAGSSAQDADDDSAPARLALEPRPPPRLAQPRLDLNTRPRTSDKEASENRRAQRLRSLTRRHTAYPTPDQPARRPCSSPAT